MSDWKLDHINADTLFEKIVVEIDGCRHDLTLREADTLMGELSVYGAKNPNRGRYNKHEREEHE